MQKKYCFIIVSCFCRVRPSDLHFTGPDSPIPRTVPVPRILLQNQIPFNQTSPQIVSRKKNLYKNFSIASPAMSLGRTRQFDTLINIVEM